MKKLFVLVLAVLLLLGGVAQAEGLDLSGWTDDQLRAAYQAIRAEAAVRGLALNDAVTLGEGRYIVGQDIAPGVYRITCVSTDMEALTGSFGSLGAMMDGLGGGDTSYGDLYSSLGSMYAALDDGAKVEIIGDYGSVIKSVQIKKGESVTLTLEGKVALKISDGSCRLEAQ